MAKLPKITRITFTESNVESVADLQALLRSSRFSTLYHRTARNADGTPQRWRLNGQLKTWKRDSNRMHLPVKYGLYDYSSIDSIEQFNREFAIGYTIESVEY